MRGGIKDFHLDPDPNVQIWRYFDLPKFLSMLRDKGLYFSRADKLGDPLEGSYTRALQLSRERLLQQPPDGMTREMAEESISDASTTARAMPRCTYVNCWHRGQHESMAMWRGYGQGPYGIAVRSTVGLLDDVLPLRLSEAPMAHIFLGEVDYVDYSSDSDLVWGSTVYAPFVYKSTVYSSEEELRAVFVDWTLLLSQSAPAEGPDGIVVPTDLHNLIQQVIVSPLAPTWFDAVVASACKAYGFAFEIVRSGVFGQPVF